MITSMTGYGHASFNNDNIFFEVEIKSINSKNMDLTFHCSRLLTSREMVWRSLANSILKRGKINISINIEFKSLISSSIVVDKESFINTYNYLKELSLIVRSEDTNLFEIALKNTVNTRKSDSSKASLSEAELKMIDKTLEEAILKCNKSRELEGERIFQKFKEYLENINKNLNSIVKQAPQRLSNVKNKLKTRISEVFPKNIDLDNNRFEQELIYYIEKLDIEEEIIRLNKHLSYFKDVLNSPVSSGKKSLFIMQEISREINTIGSKANDADIQNKVVLLKEEVEKLREQLQNIL